MATSAAMASVTQLCGPQNSGIGAVALQTGIDGVFRQQLVDEPECCRREILFGDERDGLMALATPGPGGSAGQPGEGQSQESGREARTRQFHRGTPRKKKPRLMAKSRGSGSTPLALERREIRHSANERP